MENTLEKYFLIQKAEETKDGSIDIFDRKFAKLEHLDYTLKNMETKYECEKLFETNGMIYYKKKSNGYIFIIHVKDFWEYNNETHKMTSIITI